MARERWNNYLVPHKNAHVNELPGTVNQWHVIVEEQLSRDLGQHVSHVTALTTRLSHAGLEHVITPTHSNRVLSRDRSWMNPLIRHALSTARHPELCAQVVLKPRDQRDVVQALVSDKRWSHITDTSDSVSFAVRGPRVRSKFAAVAVT